MRRPSQYDVGIVLALFLIALGLFVFWAAVTYLLVGGS